MGGFSSNPTGSGFSANPSMGSFKSANSLGAKLPAAGSTIRGTGDLTQHAEDFSFRHATKGLGMPKVPGAKMSKPVKMVGKQIGRKRGY